MNITILCSFKIFKKSVIAAVNGYRADMINSNKLAVFAKTVVLILKNPK